VLGQGQKHRNWKLSILCNSLDPAGTALRRRFQRWSPANQILQAL